MIMQGGKLSFQSSVGLFVVSSIFLIPIGLLGCSREGTRADSPSEVVAALVDACNRGLYSEASTYFSQELLNGPTGQRAGGIQMICDGQTRGGTVTNFEALSENIRGEGAIVVGRIHFKDGSTKDQDRTALMRIDGSWKVTFDQ
jgi:hypothetical protein